MHFPSMTRIRQHFEAPVVTEIAQAVQSQIAGLQLQNRIQPGQSVAVACSSRGIANYDQIVGATIEALRQWGLVPYVVPAMGSHGAASAEGQQQVLQNYGICEAALDAPVRSSLEVVRLGETDDRVPVYIDRHASEADHIVVVNRVKAHTEFTHDIESGLMKMMAIGLGKEKGATLYHQAIMRYGYPHVIVSVAREVLRNAPLLFGVGIVENGYGQTAQIRALTAAELEKGEKKLLVAAKQLAAKLPFDEADVLVIDEMGKDISGTGFDTKVVGRILMPLVAKEPKSPRIKRIVVCDLTPNTAGNADGVGIADFVTQRLVDKIDRQALYVNAIAGAEPEHAKIPLTLANDREALKVAIGSVGLIPLHDLKIMRIENTNRLAQVDVSAAYAQALDGRKDIEIIDKPHPMRFDDQGNLEPY